MRESAVSIGQLDAPFRGILFIIAGISIFSIQDVVIKWISGDYSVHQILFVRSVVALVPLFVIVRLNGGLASLRTRRPVIHLVRAILMLLAYTTFYLALAAMKLADTVALFFSAPLFVTALSVPCLGEKVGFRRWAAVSVGFVGVLVMMRPGSGVVEPAALLAVAAALFYATSAMLTRRLGATDNGASMTFYATTIYVVITAGLGLALGDGALDQNGHVSLRFLLRAWVWPTWPDFALMAFCGLIAAFGFYCLSQAYRLAQVNVVAPFEYVALPWAVAWGFVFWGDIPDAQTMAGISLVVGSGLYVLHREALRGRRTVAIRGIRPRV